MLDERFVILGAVIALSSTVLYALETLKGKTKPNRVTWFLWMLAPAVAFAAQLSEGVGLQSLLTFTVGFGPLLVLLASFRNKDAFWAITRFDLVCGFLSVLALILWLLTGEGVVAIVLSILADLLAATPTIVKSYKDPSTESWNTYAGGSTAGFITLLTIDNWTVSNYAFSLYIFLAMGLIATLVAFPKLRLGRVKS